MKLCTQNVPIPPPEQLAHLVSANSPACWLDSSLADHPRSRYSIFVCAPLATLKIDSAGRGFLQSEKIEAVVKDPLHYLDEWLQAFNPFFQEQDAFCGGVLGFLSYESYSWRCKLQPRVRQEDLPDGFFMLVDTALVMDHLQSRAWVFSLGICEDLKSTDYKLAKQRCADLIEIIQHTSHEGAHGSAFVATSAKEAPVPLRGSMQYDLSRSNYLQKIQIIREAIFRGDCYQVNFAQRFVGIGEWDPAALYLRFRNVSPAPQMSYIHIGDLQILSGSPEVLLETEGKVIKSYPIKGTCSRYEDNSTDLKMQDRLLKSEKDGAELLMIVDLVRNDLGKICEIGSVQVQSLKTLESFAQVHHLVASVEGKLKALLAPLQALAELSPGGSITGAPKLKAMEIINELEEEPRGVYTGSIGYAGFNGKSCFNIAIRTATLRKNHLEYWAGGGIVADSNPEAEYEESLQKAKGFFEALRRGEA